MINIYLAKRTNPQDNTTGLYATACTPSVVTLDKLADDICQECTVTEHDVKGVLRALEDTITSYLQEGRSVRLGDLGSFHLTAKSTRSATQQEVDAAKVMQFRVRFTKSATMEAALNVKGNPRLRFSLRADKSGTPINGGLAYIKSNN